MQRNSKIVLKDALKYIAIIVVGGVILQVIVTRLKKKYPNLFGQLTQDDKPKEILIQDYKVY